MSNKVCVPMELYARQLSIPVCSMCERVGGRKEREREKKKKRKVSLAWETEEDAPIPQDAGNQALGVMFVRDCRVASLTMRQLEPWRCIWE